MQRREKGNDSDKRKIDKEKVTEKADSDKGASQDDDTKLIKLDDIRYSDFSSDNTNESKDYTFDQITQRDTLQRQNIYNSNLDTPGDYLSSRYNNITEKRSNNISRGQYLQYSRANKENDDERYIKEVNHQPREINTEFLEHAYVLKSLASPDINTINYINTSSHDLNTSPRIGVDDSHSPDNNDGNNNNTGKKRKLNQREAKKDVAEKTLHDYFFEVINEEAKLLNLHPYFLKNTSLTNNELQTQKDAQNPANYTLDHNADRIETISSNEHSQDENRKRGRPRSRSIEYPITEYDHNGMRIDPVTSAIDFRDEMFIDTESIGNKNYICPKRPKCKKTFPSLSRAKRHFIVHLGIKPFKCENPNCPKTFSRRDNMLQHYNKHCSATKKQSKGTNHPDDKID